MSDTTNKLEDLEVLNGDEVTGAGCGPETVDQVVTRAERAGHSLEAESTTVERPSVIDKVIKAIEPDRP